MPSALSYPMNMRRYDWGFRSGAGAASRRPRPGHAARQGDRRIVLDQRHGLCARPCARLRHLGGDGRQGLGLSPRAALLQAHGELPRRRGGLARHRRAAPCHARRACAIRSTAPSSRRGAQAGYPVTDDYNGRQQEGFGAMEMTVWHGRRWSAANAYLRPALKTGNVKLETGALGRARHPRRPDGRRRRVRAGWRNQNRARECRGHPRASALNSPKLLMLSGIGPAKHLAEMGMPVARRPPRRRREPARPSRTAAAGRLQEADHAQWPHRSHLQGPHRAGMAALQIGPRRHQPLRDPAASSARAPASNIRTSSSTSSPPPSAMTDRRPPRAMASKSIVGPNRSKSRGWVKLALAQSGGRAPRAASTTWPMPQDWADFRAAIRLAREIVAQDALKPYRGRRDRAGRQSPDRRRDRRLCARACRERLSPLRHLPDGRCARPAGRRRSANAA